MLVLTFIMHIPHHDMSSAINGDEVCTQGNQARDSAAVTFVNV